MREKGYGAWRKEWGNLYIRGVRNKGRRYGERDERVKWEVRVRVLGERQGEKGKIEEW